MALSIPRLAAGSALTVRLGLRDRGPCALREERGELDAEARRGEGESSPRGIDTAGAAAAVIRWESAPESGSWSVLILAVERRREARRQEYDRVGVWYDVIASLPAPEAGEALVTATKGAAILPSVD